MAILQDFRDLDRLKQIIAVLLKHGMGFFVEKIRLGHFIPFHKRILRHKFSEKKVMPEKARLILQDLGGTFVKLGQLLSLRPDLIPNEYCEEFKKLLDEIPPFSYAEAKEVIESELKKPIGKIFSNFDKKPIGSASIGQVYRAVLKNGQVVAVKIQRPGIKKSIETDIDIMYKLASLFEKNIKFRAYSPKTIIEEFELYTKNELDYKREARSIEKIYKNFVNYNNVKIPKVFWDYSTEKILVMEYIEGVKLSEIEKLKTANKRKIAGNIINAFMKQVMEDGFFHADMHPGNIVVLKNNKIALLDFGITGRLDNELREKGIRLLTAIVEKNPEEVTESLLEIGTKTRRFDVAEFEDEVEGVLETLRHENNAAFTNAMYSLVSDTCPKYGLKLPVDLILLAKGVVTAEGTCRNLDSRLNFIEVSKPYVDNLMRKESSPKRLLARLLTSYEKFKKIAYKFPERSASVLEKLDKGELKIEFEVEHREMHHFLKHINRLGNRIIVSLILAAVIVASAMIASTGQPSYIPVVGFAFSVILALMLLLSMMRKEND